MRKKIYKNRFGKINLKWMLDNMKKNESDVKYQTMLEYNHYNQRIEWIEDEIEDLKRDIVDKERELERINDICENIYKDNSHLVDDYYMKFNISKQNKKLTDGSVGVFWILNLKYKRSNKSIYLGSDNKVREIVSKVIESKKKLSEDRLRSEIYDMCFDKLFELVKGRDNLYDLKIKFENLV